MPKITNPSVKKVKAHPACKEGMLLVKNWKAKTASEFRAEYPAGADINRLSIKAKVEKVEDKCHEAIRIAAKKYLTDLVQTSINIAKKRPSVSEQVVRIARRKVDKLYKRSPKKFMATLHTL